MISLTNEPLEIQRVIASVDAPGAGGIDVFIGTTRDVSRARSVLWLEYEAYEPMASTMMERLAQVAHERWAVLNISIAHRLGRVNVGEASVVIAVSSAHREEAFAACRFLIDELKKVVPIWKREFFADGTVEWSRQVHEQQGITTEGV
ncbi:MAG: molybdenum cofactor biosynthesis protein MoaE [Ignavibacteriales bacterium]|nr:molybdenum cofactor biosynthesis protein MoaE [Ignavibacteriales bacterium]